MIDAANNPTESAMTTVKLIEAPVKARIRAVSLSNFLCKPYYKQSKTKEGNITIINSVTFPFYIFTDDRPLSLRHFCRELRRFCPPERTRRGNAP